MNNKQYKLGKICYSRDIVYIYTCPNNVKFLSAIKKDQPFILLSSIKYNLSHLDLDPFFDGSEQDPKEPVFCLKILTTDGLIGYTGYFSNAFFRRRIHAA